MSPRFVLAVLLLALAACDASPDTVETTDTWPLIRDQVFAPRCTGACHAAGTTYATQSGLVLTPDVAYEQLVGVEPTNEAARAAGLRRVVAQPGSDLHEHFLWEKVNAPGADHMAEEHPGFGALMPLGGDPLTYGELALIRGWLQAGAPRTGILVDAAVLADTARYRAGDFEPLPQLDPAEGWSIRLGPFDVPGRFEREFFYYEPAPDNTEHQVDRVQISMRSGSHHFILYGYPFGPPPGGLPAPRTFRDLRFANGTLDPSVMRQMSAHVFYAGTQWPRLDYAFPPGVALRIPAGQGFDLNAHYVNGTTASRQGEVQVNLHWADPGSVQHMADILNLNNLDLTIPPGESTITKTFTFPDRRHVFQLFSHAHRRMTRFDVYISGGPRDGERIYRATDWEHPPILEIDPPLTLERGQGLRLETTYFNETSQVLRFGFLSEDEMMILFGYYFTD